MEEHWQANEPVLQRAHPEYARLKRSLTRWRGQLQGRIPMGRQTVDGLRRKIADAEAARQLVPSYAPRQTLRYCRFADDYLVVMGGYGTADANRIKDAMATWLQDQLGLQQHPDKTRMTHWSKPVRFLGYDVRGQRNLHGTRWARLLIPPEAKRDGKQRVKRVCGFTQIPMELFHWDLAEEKTRHLEFGRYAWANAYRRGEKPKDFAFLGMTFFCGKPVMARSRSSARLLARN